MDIKKKAEEISNMILSDDLDGAIEQASHLIEIVRANPKLSREVSGAHFMRGYALNEAGRHREAIPDLDQSIAHNKTFGIAFFQRGVARYRLGETAMAKSDLLQATRLSNKRQPDEFLELADLYMEEGDFENALATYRASDEVERTMHSTTRQIEALIELSRNEDALEKCESNLPKDDPYACSFRGWISMLQHDYDKAHEELIQATKGMDDDCGAYAYYGLAWLVSTCPVDSIRDAELARFNLEKAENIQVISSWEIHRVEVSIAANCEEWDQAEQLQRQVVSECPSWAKEFQNAVLEFIKTRTPIRSISRGARVFPS